MNLFRSDVTRNTQHVNIKFILFTFSFFVFGCSATSSIPVGDQLEGLQQSVATLKQTYDEKISTYDEKIASLEQQLRSHRMLVPQSGSVYFTSFCLIPFQNMKTNNVKFTYVLYLLHFSVEVPVAFSTRLTDDTSINDSPVIFETVDLNIGDGYDEFTGNSITNITFISRFEES